ncbi:hypothetical protein [Coleofasciculus sp. FACHB-T130]|uniref:hypothetical protein n=1 Tax=Cyanophyceae TaxID=3028117 RepID=UPI001681DD26|nr:hypothetical protein [Coleofasciculus sp. FACHB-T130]MBD1880745.1 hypothetical protein [Coleofasciculus sp. FACHB-T130]
MVVVKYQTVDEIENLIAAFKNCTLPRDEWNHHAHLTVAVWYLTRYSKAEATNCIRDRIQHYNKVNGIQTTNDSGYHETITLFWIRLISRYLSIAGKDFSIVDIVNEFIKIYGNKSFPLQYYSRDRLMSWQARISWTEPDLKPLD